VTGWYGGGDVLSFGAGGVLGASNFTTAVATDYTAATAAAENAFSHHFHVVAVQVGADTVVFNDNGSSGHFDPNSDQAVVLVGHSLADIGPSNILV
jgi:hypothetical protein